MKKIIYLLALLLSGCATVFSGTSDDITFTSNPEGATVYVDRELIGSTPTTVEIDRELHNSIILYKLDGYKDLTLVLARTFNKLSILNITVVPSWLIDLFTGAIMKAKYKTHHADLISTDKDS